MNTKPILNQKGSEQQQHQKSNASEQPQHQKSNAKPIIIIPSLSNSQIPKPKNSSSNSPSSTPRSSITQPPLSPIPTVSNPHEIDPKDVPPDDCIKYGDMCYRGLPPDNFVYLKEAAQFYKKAADSKNVEGMIKYGNMCRYGLGTVINIDEAIKYYKLAADSQSQEGNKLYNLLLDREKNMPEIHFGSPSEVDNNNRPPTPQTPPDTQTRSPRKISKPEHPGK